MHLICKECFEKAGPLEALAMDPFIKGRFDTCAYCFEKLGGWSHTDSHLLPGDTPHMNICVKLGISTKECSYFDFIDQQRDIDVQFEQKLAKEPCVLAVQAMNWLNSKRDPGKSRIARIIGVLLANQKDS